MLQGEPWHKCKKMGAPFTESSYHQSHKTERTACTEHSILLNPKKKNMFQWARQCACGHSDVPLTMRSSLNLHFILWCCILAWCLTFWWQEIKQKRRRVGLHLQSGLTFEMQHEQKKQATRGEGRRTKDGGQREAEILKSCLVNV